DMRSAQEAVSYLKKLHALVRYLQICDGNMQEGSFRCDANVSVRPRGQTELGTRSELKNINSFRFVEKAIKFEIERQIDVLEDGGTVVQETRLYDPGKDETRSMRSKEEAHDYRYFPDPDLPPLEFDESFVEAVIQTLPELPDAKRDRFMSQYGLNAYDAGVLTTAREMADYYEEVVSASGADPKLVANWVTGELSGYLNKDNREIADSAVSSTALAGLIKRIADSTISGKIAKELLDAMWNGEGDADAVIEKRGLKQITDVSAIEKIVDEVLAANPVQVGQHASGEQKVFGYFVGQVMKATSGKANPKQVNEILEKKLRS
ncbi:MAG: Asp-tRNA(Asn)/Glu-tRNA(Gln) amidotransferase subunit GatB, partial [Acidiferrobacterales bacterium]